MAEPTGKDVTQYLIRLRDGDRNVISEFLPLVYQELRGVAANYLRSERTDHTLQPTALVHEAYVKLANQHDADWKDRAHFFAVAAEAMRRILIDHARKHRAAKRGEGRKVALEVDSDLAPQPDVDLLSLDEALKKLAQTKSRQSRVVELRFFGGMTVEEVAHVLGVSERTVKGDWRFARAWLQRELEGSSDV